MMKRRLWVDRGSVFRQTFGDVCDGNETEMKTETKTETEIFVTLGRLNDVAAPKQLDQSWMMCLHSSREWRKLDTKQLEGIRTLLYCSTPIGCVWLLTFVYKLSCIYFF